jgi:poly(glycerol-phosphate) alpha-glucosyltransferase
MWDIPDEYDGMTASMLQRSRAFVVHGQVEVTILTFQHRESFDDVRDRLRASGAMIDGMRLRNVWEDMSGWTDDQLRTAMPTFDRPVLDGWEPLKPDGANDTPHQRELRNESDRYIQIDHLRPDGTLLASDRRHGDRLRDRSVILCDTRGEPMGAWRRGISMFALWLDALPRDPVAWIIADSKTSANSLISYNRPDVVKIHVVQGSHLRREDGSTVSRLVRSRRGASRSATTSRTAQPTSSRKALMAFSWPTATSKRSPSRSDRSWRRRRLTWRPCAKPGTSGHSSSTTRPSWDSGRR